LFIFLLLLTDDNEMFWQELENQPGPLAEEEGSEVIIAGSGNHNIH